MKHKWAKPAKLNTFLKKHRGSDLPLLPDFIRPRDPVAVLIHSWLLWEASTEQAEIAMRKLLDAFVDYNEIRVSLPHEKASVIGKRYPRLEERLHGIRRTLHSLYLARHALSFEHLEGKGKRDIKADIESLDGMHPFVAARILRLSFEVHALPADDQLSALLHEHGVIDEPVDPDELSSWLGSAIKSDDAIDVIAALQTAIDEAWGKGVMSKLVRKHRPTRVVEVEEIVVAVEPEPEPEATKKTPAKKTSAKKTPAKKTPAKKTPAKKSPAAKKAPGKKVVKKSTTKKSPAGKVAKKSTTKKTTAKKTANKKSANKKSANKASTKKASAKKTAKKSPARKTGAKKTAKKAAARSGAKRSRS